LTKNDVIILSNFTAKGRAGEEIVAAALLRDWGYQIFTVPTKFEGDPELKYLRDNIYFGGYGQRTDIKSLQFIRDHFEAKIIPLYEKDKRLYHLDCSCFVLSKEDVMLCTTLFTPEELKRVAKVANIVDVSINSANFGICNSLKVDGVIYNNSNLPYLKKTDEEYPKERKKNDDLEKLCRTLGLEVLYFDMSEVEKSGAFLSCTVANLSGAHARS
jgi:N-dimethylarginine dimethylaminohydrolase